MDALVSLVILGEGGGPELLRTVEDAERQAGPRREIVLVDHGGRSPIAEGLVFRGRARRVEAPPGPPGAWRNAGVRAATGAYVAMPDPGCRLGPGYLAGAQARLEEDPGLGVVSAWALLEHDAGGRALLAPPGCDLTTLLVRPDAVHPAAVFRHAAWEAVGGFDETLPALEDMDLWIRLARAGWRAAVLEAPLLTDRVRSDSPRLRALLRGRDRDALRALYERHREAFARDPAAVLVQLEEGIRALGRTHEVARARREAQVAELAALDGEIARLEGELGAGERPPLDWGDLRRVVPVDPDWGYARGTPVDRYYIERFLEAHAGDIRGTVLEVQEDDYTRRFGGERVERSDVVDVDPANARTTIVADLRGAPAIPDGRYDCVILTQTLHVIDDMRAALVECRRILGPGGVLLATLPCTSRVCLEYGPDGDFWRVTEAGARRLVGDVFSGDDVQVRAHGNVLAQVAFLQGLSWHELTADELDTFDPYHPLLVTVRAQKGRPPAPSVRAGAVRMTRPGGAVPSGGGGGVVLLYHRVAELSSDVHGLAVTPADFWSQMEHLRRHYRPMPLLDLAAAAGRLPPRAVAVTFDDGYADVLEVASPMLAALGVPATFFVGAPARAEDGEFWWDTLERVLVLANPVPGYLELTLAGERRHLPTATRAERLATHATLHAALRLATLEAREALMAAVVAWGDACGAPRASHRRLTADDLRRLAAKPGHAVGAHGLHHLALPRQPREGQCREVTESRAALERATGGPVVAFAYPFGAHSEESLGVVRGAGFDLAVTGDAGVVDATVNPLRMPRLTVRPEGAPAFAEWLAHAAAATTGAPVAPSLERRSQGR